MSRLFRRRVSSVSTLAASGGRVSVQEPIVVENLSRRFGENTALDGISLRVNAGELFGLVGPDGAGKTTLFRILSTLLLPDTGRATVLGFDVGRDLWEIRASVGYMPGRFSLYPDLSVEENLRFFAAVFGTTVDEGYAAIAPIYRQIEPFRERRAGALSGGMKQKLALCCALVHRPQLLLLDEPTTGVDAVSRRELWDLLAELKASGLPILVATPYMDEAARCDRIGLMQAGRLLAVDEPGRIGDRVRTPLLSITGPGRYRMLLRLRQHPDALSVHPFGDTLHYADRRTGVTPQALAAEIRSLLRQEGFEHAQVVPIRPGVEDAFLALIEGREEAPAA